MLKNILIVTILIQFLYATSTDEASNLEAKNEIITLKKELTEFYNKKEEEYKKRKKELENILNMIETEKANIDKIKKENQQVLDDIKNAVDNKTSKIYEGMKPKVAATILNKMMSEGNVEDVFDIILKLKEKNIVDIMRYLNVEYAAILTERLKAKSKI